MANQKVPVFAVRGSSGISLHEGPPSYERVSAFADVRSRSCKTFAFSPFHFAWSDGSKILVAATSTWKIVCEIDKPKTQCLSFSPKGTYLCSWEVLFTQPQNPKGNPNLCIWKTENGELVHSFTQSRQMKWEPQFSADETICARSVDGQVLIYERGDFEKPAHKISNPKVVDFSVSPGNVCHFLCYMPGKEHSFGKLFQYPNFRPETCVASKTFFKADKVDMYWNSKGTSVLLLTSNEVDKTGKSYYGNQCLFSLSTKGDSVIVVLNKEGPIHAVSWNPNGDEFCVIYGTMPSKAALFNLKSELIHDFGTGPRNSIYYNPHGNILLLGGFGNISGHVDIYEVAHRKKIVTTNCSNTTLLQWSPDGIHFLTATTAPRLRVGNGFKIYHYSGSLMYELPWNKQEELWEVGWQVFPPNSFKKPAINFKQVEGIKSNEPNISKEPYRPPGARGLPSLVKFNLHDDENNSRDTKVVSKNILKQKKKREAKRLAKLQSQQEGKPTENDLK